MYRKKCGDFICEQTVENYCVESISYFSVLVDFFVSKLKCGEFVLVDFFMSTISTVKSGEYIVSTFKSGEFYHSLLILFTSLYILFSLIYMQLQMIGLSVIYENLTLIYDLRNTQMHAF